MSTLFSADWLSLREAADHRARAVALLPPLTEWLPDHHVQVTDLGAGSGSNMRYLAPLLPGEQSWYLVDQDATLMKHAVAPMDHVQVECRTADLRHGPLIPGPVPDVVTASALLDLVSREWLEQFARDCLGARCAILIALSYDGRIQWQPKDPDDQALTALVNAHQRQDKGFGSALGPDGADVAASVFRETGFRTWLSPSPWHLGPRDIELQTALLDGWMTAAREQAGRGHAHLDQWARRRRESMHQQDARLTVGHLDLLALPPATR